MENERKTENCVVCGAPLVYFTQKQEGVCQFCGRKFLIDAQCEHGHYVCDECLAKDAAQVVTDYCMDSGSYDPLTMAAEIMAHPSVPMHGPEHHYLVPAVLVCAYCNRAGLRDKKAEYLAEAQKRSATVPGDSCGFNGVCGAAVGAGIYLSIISGATPLSRIEWKLSNLITSECLVNVAVYGGPRCCKRDVFLALEAAVKFSLKYNICTFDEPDGIVCAFYSRCKECIKQECPFYPGK